MTKQKYTACDYKATLAKQSAEKFFLENSPIGAISSEDVDPVFWYTIQVKSRLPQELARNVKVIYEVSK
jgi:hypothetical protein